MKDRTARLEETLRIFNNRKIEVIPNYNVKDGKNTKDDFKPTISWKDTRISYRENIKALKDGVLGFMVRTGIKSNITVIDYDYHGVETSNTTDILNRLKETSTFYLTTPTGGFHFYFKYEKRLSRNRAKIFNNIDIKSEDGLIYLGVRNDGEYTINNINSSIREIPEDIIKELNEWKKSTMEVDVKNGETEEQIFNNILHKGKRYNITEEQLYKYLYDLPAEYLDNTPEWKTITFILKEYGYKDVWDRWSKRSVHYDYDNNMKVWRVMKTDKNRNDYNYIITLLNNTTYKDNNISPIRKIFKDYNPLSDANLKKLTSYINTKYLNKSLHENGKDIIVSSQLNTGKSYSNIQNALINKKLYFSIVALTSTQESQYQGFKEAGIPSFSYKNIKKPNNDYKYIKFVEDEDEKAETPYVDNVEDTDDTEDIKDLNNILENNNNIDLNKCCIFTTIDSLLLFKDRNINFKDYIIYLDEIHSLFLYLLRCDNLSKKRMEIFSFLIKIMRECDQIIAVDGDICNNTIALMDLLKREPYEFFINTYKSYNDIKCIRKADFNKMIEHIKADIDNKEFNICCCNTKTLADKLEELYLKMGVSPSQILKYTSKSGKPIKNIKEEWENKYILYSPSIVAGLDFTPPTAINTYSFIEGTNTLNPEQIGQQICRNRNIKNVYLYMAKMTNILSYKDMNTLKDHYKVNIVSLKLSASFISLMNRNYDPITNDIIYTDTIFNEMYYELEYQNDIMKSSYEYNLCTILTKKGFVVIDDTNINIGLNKEINTIITEKIADNEATLYDSFVDDKLDDDDKYKNCLDKRLEILCISKDDDKTLLKYNDIIGDDNVFNTHLKIRCLLNDDEMLKKKFNEYVKTENIIKLSKNDIFIIINYKRIMRSYLPEIDLYNYEYKHDDKYLDDDVNINLDDFKCIKNVIRTTKKIDIPTNKNALVDLMNLYATHIFSKDLIKSVRVDKKIKGKSVSYYSRAFNKDLFINHISLYKICLERSNICNICNVIKHKYYKDLYNDTPIGANEIDEVNKIISFYNIIAVDEKVRLDIINKPIKEAEAETKIKADEEAEILLKAKSLAKQQKYNETIAKMIINIDNAKDEDAKVKGNILYKEYQQKHKKYLLNQQTKATKDLEAKMKAEAKANKPLTLQQKILSYLPIDPITDIEDAEYFKQVYNEVIKCSYNDKQNILQEYKHIDYTINPETNMIIFK